MKKDFRIIGFATNGISSLVTLRDNLGKEIVMNVHTDFINPIHNVKLLSLFENDWVNKKGITLEYDQEINGIPQAAIITNKYFID